MKFFGIKERENETNNDTELFLREFMRTKLKILPVDEENIHIHSYPILKAVKRENNAAYFNVEKLIIDGALCRDEKTSQFSFYGRLLNN